MSTTPLSAEEFIDRLEFLGLLEEKVLDNLRRQVAESKKPVAPQTLAKLLVDTGQLTAFQAKKLVGEEVAAPAKQSPVSPPAAAPQAPVEPKPAVKAETQPKPA